MVKEKYLPYEPQEKPEQPQKTEKEIRKEKWENFWFYYKKPIIIALVTLVFVAIAFEPWRKRENPDYHIYLASPYYWSDSNLEDVEEIIELYAEDVNKDGEVCVNVVGYMIDQSATDLDSVEMMQTYMSKLVADISTVEGFIFLLDEPCAEWLGKGEHLFSRIQAPYDNLNWTADNNSIALEDFAYDWHDVQAFAESRSFREVQLDLFFCLRELSGTAEKHTETRQQAEELLTRMQNHTPVDEARYEQWLAEQKEN